MKVETCKFVLTWLVDCECVAEPFVGFPSGNKLERAKGMAENSLKSKLTLSQADTYEMFSKESQRQWVKSYVGYISVRR